MQPISSITDIAAMLKASNTVAICGHVSPDGDCIGSQLALQLALESLGKRVIGLLAQDEPIDESLSFLPGSDRLVPAACYDGAELDAFVAVDVPTTKRMGEAATTIMRAAHHAAVIDHHAADESLVALAHIDPQAPSASTLVWQLVCTLGAERVRGVAECCYVGLLTDTGRFQFQNTTPMAFACASEMVAAGADPAYIAREVYQNRSLASLALEDRVIEHLKFSDDGACVLSWLSATDFEQTGAVKTDADALIGTIRSLRGVRIACMLREQEGAVRGNLRAKDNTDVSAIARRYGGGGHRAAAGFTLECSLDQARITVMEDMQAALVSSEEG
ncbi:bifunctional oligoribonuclease/PAP phosphatase NrnA [Adlercreutzia sp. ZJ138]|uniref:DHH family phosphoesterase n=1 Tax=Adlercreutzia sp. ZJ138 TaxID=2709405 RepID=UPI0013EB53A6|nr:DHH family phosphoesterase [Adlercreutzia sp. ZJ138]